MLVPNGEPFDYFTSPQYHHNRRSGGEFLPLVSGDLTVFFVTLLTFTVGVTSLSVKQKN